MLDKLVTLLFMVTGAAVAFYTIFNENLWTFISGALLMLLAVANAVITELKQ